MHLLEGVAPEVYKAYFPRSIAASDAVSLAASDNGSENNYKKWPPLEKSPYFPSDQICSEDPDWDRIGISPPSLAQRCIQVLARFFSVKPDAGCGLKGGDRAKFINLLSTREPILLTAEKIPDELYWKRCCADVLNAYDSSRHGGSYKRLFLEKHLQGCIERFVPQQTDLFDIKDMLAIMEPYIKRLEITELLPPTMLVYPGREEDNLDDDEDGDLDVSQDSNSLPENTVVTSGTHDASTLSRMGPPLPAEINMKIPANHFDFGAIFPNLSQLEEFHVCYKVKSCGVDFRWNMFGITSKDADNLGAGLKICKRLKVLKIHNSKMDDDKFYSVFDGLKNLSGLETINFQNNVMTDESSESLIKLISGQNNLKKLDLTNNRMGCKMASMMATYLTTAQAKSLEVFNFSLNSLKDDGMAALSEALVSNTTLITLDVSSNFLTSKSGNALKQMISNTQSLKNLNVSCNPLKVDGCIKILEGIKKSEVIQRIDIRLTGCSRDIDLSIQESLKKIRLKCRKAPSFSTSSRSSTPSLSKSGSSKKYPYPKC